MTKAIALALIAASFATPLAVSAADAQTVTRTTVVTTRTGYRHRPYYGHGYYNNGYNHRGHRVCETHWRHHQRITRCYR